MDQYLNLLRNIKEKGTWKDPARDNMPKTKSLFGTRMEFDMADGFPLLTTKKMFYKGIIVELLWFLKGGTNIKYLIDRGCNIWNQDAYRWYLSEIAKERSQLEKDHNTNPLSLDRFITLIKDMGNTARLSSHYKLGDLGKVYGHQWRNQNGVDQIADVIHTLNTNPLSRYLIIDGWNKADFKDMALPPCHLLYQFNYREEKGGKYLDLQMYQRSCDTFLGVPFNIASASLLLHIISKTVGMIPGKFIWIGGDTHLYENHMDQVDVQLRRLPKALPKLEISKSLRCLQDIEFLKPEDILIKDYKSHDRIKADLSVGL
ncbi:thymidylate synthase [Tenacibaculum sp.]|uniref:thymidylate synthase n=1 Tax=Tenacibaculum sp. TaxID=1906242 RepID=UPI003D10A2D6